MDSLLSYIQEREGELKSFIREMVECESPTGDAAALGRMRELIADRVASFARVRVRDKPHFGCEFQLPGRGKQGQIMALGHFDTVWPLGTLKTMPFAERDGRLWGPGVLDMKTGIALFLFAMEGIRELGIGVKQKVKLRLVADEEIGSPSSREGTGKMAQSSQAVLVLEPGTGLEGAIKTSRKGVARYRLEIAGRASHSGLDFAAGASAVLELARQLERVAAMTDLDRGITVNPGIIAGGTRANVVPAAAHAEIDVRVVRSSDAERIDRKMRRLRPIDRRCSVKVSGGLVAPPMERTAGIARLYRLARRLAAGMGVEAAESASGGASDGNFTASLGIPTLDGLGAVGEGAHAAHESILTDRLADRAALLGKLVAAL